jgi:signal transduction histidine kinase
MTRSVFVVVAIAIVAAGLSLVTYQYSTVASARILDIASDEARTNSEMQARTLSSALGNKIASVSINLETMAKAQSIQSQDLEGAKQLIYAAQQSTADITSGYVWLDRDGKILWAASFSNATTAAAFAGSDFSYRDYYVKPKETLKSYYSTVMDSIDGVPRLTISYPVIGEQINGGITIDDEFKGVVSSGIEVDTLGKFMESQLVSSHKSNMGLMDREGRILYSSSSPQFIGKNIFDPEVQSVLPIGIKDSFNQFIQDSLKGNEGLGDFSLDGKTSTIAYQPITIRGSDFAILYVVTPHEFAGDVVALVEQQRIMNVIIVTAIGGGAVVASAVVFTWNRRLREVVTAKTSELKFANQSLAESNMQLEVSNTKLREANQQLEESNEKLKVHDRLQKEFVNIAAHELRTPIQPLLGAAEIIESQFENKENIEVTKAEVEMILRNAKRLERLSSDILEVSRIESGGLKLNIEKFSLSYVIADAIKDAKARSIYDPETLAISFIPDLIFVDADKGKITQVLSNLLANAIKFTAEKGGTIAISTEEDAKSNMVTVIIKDTGEGIDPEVKDRLFDKFVTKSETGTGSGLYISKNIVEYHGGRIWGENNTDEPGATFGFTLPISPDISSKLVSSTESSPASDTQSS